MAPATLAVGEFLEQHLGAAFDHHRRGILARAFVQRLPGGAGGRGDVGARHVGAGDVVRFQG